MVRKRTTVNISLAVQTIPETDLRIPLRNQKGLFAAQFIEKDSFMGIYLGKMQTEEEFQTYCISYIRQPPLFFFIWSSLHPVNHEYYESYAASTDFKPEGKGILVDASEVF